MENETYAIIDRKTYEIESPVFDSVKAATEWANENMLWYWNKFSQIAIVEELRQAGLIK
jgi:hypothetical protein